jgi:arsenite methyltransferase
MDSENIYAAVGSHYSAVSADPSKTTDAYSRSVAQSFGYTQDELDSIPDQSNLGLSCGNPLALASLREVRLNTS